MARGGEGAELADTHTVDKSPLGRRRKRRGEEEEEEVDEEGERGEGAN